MSRKDLFADLIGKEVGRFHASDDHQRIGFACADGTAYRFFCEGDCCSYSWAEHITGLKHLIGAKIAEVVEKPMIDDINSGGETDDRGEAVQVWGYTFVTNRGYFDIELRNASNGYYGGWVQPEDGDINDLPIIQEDF